MKSTLMILVLALGFSNPAFSAERQISGKAVNVEVMATNLDEPWAITFLPKGHWLVTLRAGVLRHYRPDGAFQRVKGLPRVLVKGQGGLLDVVVAKDFAKSREIFLSYSKGRFGKSGTALASARLSEDGARLTGLRVLFQMKSRSNGGSHFGSRIVEASDGTLFLTLGDRGDRKEAQNLGSHNGTIVRITREGRVPVSNPKWKAGGLAEIWSYGHRNPQGAAIDQKGQLWAVEHGAKGGDEINRIAKGANFGWPVIAYGRHYNGSKIGEGFAKTGMEQPAHFWDPSIAPSGMMIYSGRLWPDWLGDFFVGSLKFHMISRLTHNGGALKEVERIKSPETNRVRDVREAPDGSIWFLSVGKGAAYRITPAK